MGVGRHLMEAAAGATGRLLAVTGLRRLWLGRSLPPARETLRVPGLRARVQVLLDGSGVPHIYAENWPDLFLAQGYVHARDRLWQMELNRRVARGELAELFGEAALEMDRFLRRLGFRRQAEKEAAALSEEVGGVLAAYAAGVNSYSARHRLPAEFSLLRARPREWEAVDSLSFGRYIGWSLTLNWETELVRARLIAALGLERVARLEPGCCMPALPEVLLGSADKGPVAEEHPPPSPSPEGEKRSGHAAPPLPQRGGAWGRGGSNNWVVAGARSTTGRPLLANDPHLSPAMPATWYMAHLHGGGYDVIGATLPGTPGVLIGHNAHIAWGVTLAMVDAEDLFLEEADPSEPRRFLSNDDWYEARVLGEEIIVRGRATPVVEEVVQTRHGPVLNGALDIPAGDTPLALKSVLPEHPTPLEAVLRLNRASDWPAFRAALASWAFPALNFVYADTAGNVGYKLAARVPIRAQGEGYAPVPGWTGTYEWVGYVPFDELPEVFNPPEGLFATANAKPEAPCAHFLARDWLDDGRWRRIMELLRSQEQHSVEAFQRLHGDLVSFPAVEAARQLRCLAPQGGGTKAGDEGDLAVALAYLSQWDGRLTADSVAGAIYEVFRRELAAPLHSDLPEKLLRHVWGQGVHEMLGGVSAFHFRGSSYFLASLASLLGEAAAKAASPGLGQAGPRVVQEALGSAVAWLRQHLGPDASRWHWGRLHRVTFRHPIGLAAPLVDQLLGLSRGPFPLGGDADTIAQAGIDPWHPYEAGTFTVSYRQIFDVGDWDRGLFVLPTGQSGHPGSRHYDDMIEDWLQVRYRPLWFSRPAVERETAETIDLLPADRD